jgi:hypothetical protein
MHTRIAPGLAVVAAGLVVLASGPAPTAAQDKGKAPAKLPAAGPKHLYGHDLKVRPGGDKDWPKARKIGLEVYQHEVAVPVGDGSEKKAIGFHVGITEEGVVGVFPAGPLGDKKDAQWLTGLDLLVRKGGEKEFTQRTHRLGIELFRDQRANQLIYACESGAFAFAPVPGNLSTEKGPKWHHGLAPKVREPEQETFEKAKQFGVEVYKDENTGGLIYACETGSISAGPAPTAAPDKNKVADPKHSHGLVLMVRKADEADFVTGKTKRLGVEVFEDPNAANNLIYVTEAGSVAVAPSAKFRDVKGPPKWRGAMALSARKAGDTDFAKAKRYGVEVFEDIKTGNLLFISETGSLAVLVP